MTEEQLIKSLARGEPSALEALIDRYTPYVSAVISRILRGRQADVEELTADVFLAAWDNRGKLRSGQVKGYLGAIARNPGVQPPPGQPGEPAPGGRCAAAKGGRP